ncbi:5'-methylthioadenosine/adenosylhomocysteine nucleosidase [Levilactobacillus acidifarinae]|uniref:5'-methylthioadenosine/adenosylhomocysteine nucleosidase n=1 Tax=Levilactobacillus acidifarinae TaxID=267364 RepID=UPI00070981A4|nr:5'-methylthioadenosine/adenosylhomocysteine nucleosidase [Levilactobacillus acidifarinae]GEO68574.1 5'-methylthioadenosine/S-adenosylhomocysteine nucleosidase [Levilactobacillus acidifarinae]
MTFGVICAMEEEIKELKAVLQDEQTTDIHGLEFYQGTIHDQSVVLVRSGIGKVEAGLTTALLITQFNVDVVINSGSAGALAAGLKIGDVVISTETAYHDADARAFGYEYGQLPQQPARFTASKTWGDQIAAAASQTGLTTKQGLIVSGDQFLNGPAATKPILEHFPDALSGEMEGAAVGQVAHQFDVPYVVVRAMSDTADNNSGVDFDDFIIDAGRQSAQMLLALFAAQQK